MVPSRLESVATPHRRSSCYPDFQLIMLERFKGPNGERKLLDMLLIQPIVQADVSLARKFLAGSTLRHFASGATLVSQGASEDSLFLLCAGHVSVRVNGREIARRSPGEHVGEMALLDPSAPRSATLLAEGEVVAIEVPESRVNEIATAHPTVWRAIARVLGSRLRERGHLVAVRRERPRLFIGSSTEGRATAQAVQAGLEYDEIDTSVWTDSIFAPSAQTLEALEGVLATTDFAVLILSADDIVRSRGRQSWAPRDNVVFELGLFCGALGRGRTFMLVPRNVQLKLPSDLLGLTPLSMRSGEAMELPSRVGPVCTAIRNAVTAAGPR